MTNTRWRSVAVFAFFLAVVFAVYGSFISNPFLMDDEIQILHNRHIQSLSHWPSFFTSSTMDEGGSAQMSGVYYKPLLSAYYAVAWSVFGDDPSGFRAPIWVLHAASAFFIYLFSSAFFPFLFSVFIGLFFLLHPINAEVLLYVADAQDAMYMAFGLLALLISQRTKPGIMMYLLLLLSFTASLLSKETGALFMVFAVAYAWIFDRPRTKIILAAAITVTLSYVVVRNALGLTHVASEQLHIYQASFMTRASMLPLILAHYIELLLVPWHLSMTTDFAITRLTFFNFGLPLFIVLAAIAAVLLEDRALETRRQQKLLTFCLIVIFAWMILHGQTFVALDGVCADRWAYIVSWAFITLAALAVQTLLLRQPRLRRGSVAVALMILGLFMARDVLRAQLFSKPLDLYRYELARHPWDATMSNNVGVELFRAGEWRESRKYFELSSENNPVWNVSWNNLGAVEEKAGRVDEALEYYSKSFHLGSYPLAVENYAKLLCRLDRLKECRAHVTTFLKVYPYSSVLLELKERLGP